MANSGSDLQDAAEDSADLIDTAMGGQDESH